MHKHNIRVDEYKNRWALAHGIPIVRIWEKDINDSPSRVLDELKVILGLQEKKMILTENKNKRHTNKIK
jgi:very-short-patch-repair endonuclease